MSKTKVTFGLTEAKAAGVPDLQTSLGEAGGSLEYVNRKLWVRVDELKGGRAPKDAIASLSKEGSPANNLNVPKYVREGYDAIKAARRQTRQIGTKTATVEKRLTAWVKEYESLLKGGGETMTPHAAERAITVLAMKLDDIRGDIYDLQGV